MKILAFADVHGNDNLIDEVIGKAKRKKVELLVCCGDISIFGDHLNKILMKFNHLGIPMLIIPGNHEEASDLKRVCERYGNIIYLHKGIFEVNNHAFFGFGGGGFNSKSTEFESISKKVGKRIKEKKVVLVTHQPPYRNKLDFLDFFDHVGNKSFRKFIIENKPMLSLSGHLHETFGEIDKIGKTILINPGPLGRVIEV